jgi:hypothetical protein
MNSTPSKKGFRLEPFRWKSIIKYLLQGLLVIAPIAVTIYTIYWIVSTVDNWLPIFRQPVKDFEGRTIGYEGEKLRIGICHRYSFCDSYWLSQLIIYSIETVQLV